jgi:hypothetical protein
MKLRKRLCFAMFLLSALAAGAHCTFAAEQTREYLKTRFEDGDIPSGQDFKDLIDSALNLQDDGLTIYRVGISGSLGAAARLNAGEVVGPLLSYADFSTHPPLAPLWLGQFGFLSLEFQDSSHASHYCYFQLEMASGPEPPPPGSPGPAISVEYLVWQTDANVSLTTAVAPEPSTIVLASLGVISLAAACRRSTRRQ